MKKLNLPIVVHSYFWLTILAWLLLKTSFNWGWIIFCLVGCHTTLYAFFAMIMASEAGFAWLVYTILVFWGLYCIAFVGAYIGAILKKSYLPMAIIALIDTAFSAFMVMNAIINVGFMWEHLMIIIGALLSLSVTLVLFRGIADAKKTKEETQRS